MSTIIPILIIIASIAFWVFFAHVLHTAWKNRKTHSVRGTAVIVESDPCDAELFVSEMDYNEVTVEYVYEGQLYRSRGKYAVKRTWGNDLLREGTEVEIWLNPNDPKDIIIQAEDHGW